MSMNHVERFRAVMGFQPVYRLPRWEWAMWWDRTIANWKEQGMPSGPSTVFKVAKCFYLDPFHQFWFSTMDSSVEAVQLHIEGGVAHMDDYLRIRPALYPDHARSVEAMRPWARRQDRGEVVVWASLETLYPVCVSTFVTIAEDMSYNHGPMLSKELFDEFLAPYYRRLVPRLRERDVEVIVDTDGEVTRMMPWLEGVGVQGVLPLERQAGVDGMRMREAYPRALMVGHFDKMVMDRGEAAIRSEFERLMLIMIHGVDHAFFVDAGIEDAGAPETGVRIDEPIIL